MYERIRRTTFEFDTLSWEPFIVFPKLREEDSEKFKVKVEISPISKLIQKKLAPLQK